jgi:predicted cobalt transporter CbtA
MGFAKFMASTAGRLLRIVVGIALILVGFFMLNGMAAYVVAVIGVVPLVAGLMDFCIFAPLFGANNKFHLEGVFRTEAHLLRHQ